MIGIRKNEMPRKGEMSDQDAADESVRNSADFYNVILHIPQQNSRVYFTSPNIEGAIEFAETCYDPPYGANPRAAMLHAVTNEGRFALMGTTNRFQPKYKPNVVKVY